mmetsp:Transcript_6328/g.14977  ORF Transcript_6328/g.14977 Transcript_6328/m.14977 type:complete len:135 (-) Transcript_6328:802-1206(-)
MFSQKGGHITNDNKNPPSILNTTMRSLSLSRERDTMSSRTLDNVMVRKSGASLCGSSTKPWACSRKVCIKKLRRNVPLEDATSLPPHSGYTGEFTTRPSVFVTKMRQLAGSTRSLPFQRNDDSRFQKLRPPRGD